MDPTTSAHSSAIHPSSLSTGTAPDGTPILTTTKPTVSSAATGNTGSIPAATGLRQRVNNLSAQLGDQVNSATESPAVKDAKKGSMRQVDQFRQILGRYSFVVQAEQRTGVDRVLLVVGGVLLYLLLIPINLFGLALPTTQLLTFLPPLALALRTLEKPNEDRLRTLLSYFVVFGFVQFAESLMAGLLERKIPQYYTVKLLFLAYLIHPRTKGAQKIHQAVLRPLLASAQGGLSVSGSGAKYSSSSNASSAGAGSIKTPPTSKPSQASSSANSPTFPPTTSTTTAPASGSLNSGSSGVTVPLSRTGGFSGTGPSADNSSTGFNLGSGADDKVHLPSGGGVSTGLDVPK